MSWVDFSYQVITLNRFCQVEGPMKLELASSGITRRHHCEERGGATPKEI
jgi:hypothetical protein